MNRKMFLGSLFINLLLGVFFIVHLAKKVSASHAEPKKDPNKIAMNVPAYLDRLNEFKSFPATKDEIVFLGDSITQSFIQEETQIALESNNNWSSLVKNLQIKNRGIGGDTTLGVLNRLDEVIRARPSKLFLMIGTNDVGLRSVPVIVANYKKILNDIKERSPNTKIYIESVLPMNPDVTHGDDDNGKINQLNKELQVITLRGNMIYIDLRSKVVDKNGKLDARFTWDGVHPFGEVFAKWKSEVDKYIF